MRIKITMHLMMFAGFVFGILALAGPSWKQIEIPGQQLETPMVVVLDLSPSMLAADIQPNRLERAKFKIKDLIKHNPRARMALVGFGATAHTIVPLTRDYEIVSSHIETISPHTMPFQGANLKAALALADTLTNVTEAPGTIVLLSDDFYDDERLVISNFIKTSKNKLIVLPINTQSGADMKNGERSYLDENVMTSLAEFEGVSIQPLTLDDSDVELIAQQISRNLKFTTKAEEKEDDWRDAGLLFLLPALAIFLFWFRKGWVVYSLVFMVTFTSCNGRSNFTDLWYTADYQGQKLSDNSNFEAAASTYSSEMRKGIAWYKTGNFENAIEAFAKDTTAQGAYNLGLAYYKNGDFEAAGAAFEKAIEKDPAFEAAKRSKNELLQLLPGVDDMALENAEEAAPEANAQNKQNKGEDFSGGGQEATKEDMKKQRLEEESESSKHMGKELDELPDEIDNLSIQRNNDIMMRKVDDDPALFLQRKFAFQAKKNHIKPAADAKKW
ncbi:MAG: vWA domain-containing protein [Mangrovibacterium sp.]